jgi:hypothetical protein
VLGLVEVATKAIAFVGGGLAGAATVAIAIMVTGRLKPGRIYYQ